MTQQNTAPAAVQSFKNVYGKTHELVPRDFPLQRDIKWDETAKVGEKFVVACVLGNEVGITLGGSGTEAFEINPAIAGPVKQAEVQPYVTVLPSIIPWSVISRSAGGGDKAFFDNTKHIVKNNIRSHGKFHEIFRFYGQAADGLGYVSFATATYRGVALTDGAGTVGGVAFTAGINAASKKILFGPGSFAAGHWVGMRGVQVLQIDTATGDTVGAGSLLSVDARYGIIGVSFVPVAATSATSHKIVIKGQESSGEMLGIYGILTEDDELFGIDVAKYELFRGNHTVITGKLTFEKINLGIADAVNAGDFEGDITLYVNPRSWATLSNDQAAFRKYDASYDQEEAMAGFKNIKFFCQSGMVTIKAHSCVKEGHAFGLMLSTWIRSGSAEIDFKVPGIDGEMIFPLPNQAGMAFRSYSDQFIFCHRPSWNLVFTGINDEAAS